MDEPGESSPEAGPDWVGLRSEADDLIAVIQDLSMTRSLASVQEIVRSAARRLTGADGATFVLRDGEQCFYADEDAIGPLWKGRRFPMSACISGWSMRNRRPAVIQNIFEDDRIPVDAYRPTFVKSLAMMPIRTHRPLGAIGVYWARFHLASTEEVRLLQALADSTSIAIENVRLLEELKAAKEAAEAASRLKDEFLATVSHELRTPLNPIVAWSSLLLTESLSESEAREAVAAIHDGALQELRQIEALLDVSQLIAGRLHVEQALSDLAPIVEAAIASIAPAARAKDLHIEFEGGHALPAVRVDPRRMQQVAWNLLSNAVKFTPRGGSVRVSLAATASELKLTIVDSGEGIPPEFAPHLFQRFRQADGSNTRESGGMGLGLAIVRHLVELHGGTVEASSAGAGRGSTFTVTLPLPEAPAVA